MIVTMVTGAKITDLQKRAAQAIVNVFETGRARGDYGKVTLMAGDAGHLTYGRSQTTLASGNLFLLIRDYCRADGAALADELRAYLGRLGEPDLGLDRDAELRRLLGEAGEDPIMHETQDRFFDSVYWRPGLRSAQRAGVESALGVAVVYDGRVHGSWGRIRDRTNEEPGPIASGIAERRWIEAYVEHRRRWLSGHRNLLLRRTVYRMEAFARLIAEGKWKLELPFWVRDVRIDEAVLDSSAPVRASAEQEGTRPILLRDPPLRGPDVETLQRALAARGFELVPDGVFGTATRDAVVEFQRREGLEADGIVGPATRGALED